MKIKRGSQINQHIHIYVTTYMHEHRHRIVDVEGEACSARETNAAKKARWPLRARGGGVPGERERESFGVRWERGGFCHEKRILFPNQDFIMFSFCLKHLVSSKKTNKHLVSLSQKRKRKTI